MHHISICVLDSMFNIYFFFFLPYAIQHNIEQRAYLFIMHNYTQRHGGMLSSDSSSSSMRFFDSGSFLFIIDRTHLLHSTTYPLRRTVIVIVSDSRYCTIEDFNRQSMQHSRYSIIQSKIIYCFPSFFPFFFFFFYLNRVTKYLTAHSTHHRERTSLCKTTRSLHLHSVAS